MSVRRGYVDYEHGQLHYRSAGDGVPLVALHLNPNSSAMYVAAYQPLADAGFRVVGFDTPGCGLSDAPPEPPAIADYARWLWQGIDGLRIGTCHLLGHHTGAAIACEMALAAPGRVDRLVLSGAPCFDALGRARILPLTAPRRIEPDGSHLLHIWQQRSGVMPGWRDSAAMHRGVVQSALAGDAGPWGFRALVDYDMPSRVPLLTAPTLFLTGTREGVHEPTKLAHRLVPGSELVIIDGATQDVVDEEPAAFVSAVTDFLGR